MCHTKEHEPNLLRMQTDILLYMSAYLISVDSRIGAVVTQLV